MRRAKQLVPLGHGHGQAALRELSGIEEQDLLSNDSLACIALLDQLLVEDPLADVKPGSVRQLPVCERDRLCVALYIDSFGSEIHTNVHCQACQARFSVDFSLTQLFQQLDDQQQECFSRLQRQGQLSQQADLSYRLSPGIQFRLPTGEDELTLLRTATEKPNQRSNAQHSVEDTNEGITNSPGEDLQAALIERCVLHTETPIEPQALDQLIEDIAPLVDLSLVAQCSECGAQQNLAFRIQDFLLEQILNLRQELHHQVHSLALHYGWPLTQILALPRSERLSYYQLIQKELD